ncbi:MAG: OmpW family protein, partial [Leeuwenhoekiella sp.]
QTNFFLDETGKDLNSFGLDLSFGLQYEINKSLLLEARYSFPLINNFKTLPDNYESRFNTVFIRFIYKF